MSVWRRWSVRRRVCTAALALLALSWAVRLPGSARVTGEYPRVPPAALAHMLADYTHRHDGGSWSVEEEVNNYTSWRYSVVYECGARCAGRVAVEAHDEPAPGAAPRHGAHVTRHLVRVKDRRCHWPPLLPLFSFCEETEWESRVRGSADGGAGGSRVEETATAWCAALRVLWGGCSSRLQEQLERRHQRLRLAVRAA